MKIFINIIYLDFNILYFFTKFFNILNNKQKRILRPSLILSKLYCSYVLSNWNALLGITSLYLNFSRPTIKNNSILNKKTLEIIGYYTMIVLIRKLRPVLAVQFQISHLGKSKVNTATTSSAPQSSTECLPSGNVRGRKAQN